MLRGVYSTTRTVLQSLQCVTVLYTVVSQRSGPNFEIIVGAVVKYLNESDQVNVLTTKMVAKYF